MNMNNPPDPTYWKQVAHNTKYLLSNNDFN